MQIHKKASVNAIYKNIISFFLNVSFPRIQWKVNCVFRSIATRKHNSLAFDWEVRDCKAIGASVCTKVRIVLSTLLTLIFILPFLLTLICILSFLLQLAPFVNLTVDTFPDKRGRLFCVSHFNIFCFYSHVFPLLRFYSYLPLPST